MMHPWKRLCGSNHISRFPGFVRKLSSGSASPHQHCVDLVKLHDFDSYVAGLLLPKASRSAYFAIKAFNVEIAMIKDHTHGNAMAGRIRFQWWRDLLESLYRGEGGGGAPGPASMVSASPVGRALYDAVRRHDLSERWFQRSLDARQKDLSTDQPDSLDALETQVEHTHSSIGYLVLEALGVSDEDSEYAVSHSGVAAGIATLLRALPHHASQSQCVLPRDVMLEQGLETRVVLQGATSEGEAKALRDSVFEVASQAHGHLEKARALPYTPAALYALLPSVRSSMFLEALRQADFDPTHSSLWQQESHLGYQLRCLKAALTRSI